MTSPNRCAFHWSSGDHVLFRQVWSSRAWAAIPATIIEDSSHLVSFYIAPGAIFAGPDCSREEHLQVAASGAWECKLYEWTGQHHLWASVPGEAASIWTIWSAPDWTHVGWKVNPELPLKRTPVGFDTTDHVLDAVISADLSSWRLKDEDELAVAIELGLFTVAEGDRIRRETQRIATECVTSRRPRLQAWAAWRPPAEWKRPILPQNWEAP
ncbi:MAG: DUF402 domain-containing protein [Caldilineaceae bacterium]|nr:DUF402 domain-containing protein [Caldilineaceae bacterium]